MTTNTFATSPSKSLAIALLAATVLTTSLVSGAQAGNGGGGGGDDGGDREQRSYATMTNPNGSTVTASKRKGAKGYFITKRNKFGKVTSRKWKKKSKKRIKRKGRKPSWAMSTNTRTGERRMSGTDSRGNRFFIKLFPVRN